MLVISAWVKTQYPLLPVEFVIESEPLGTGGAIQLAVEKVKGKDVLDPQRRYACLK